MVDSTDAIKGLIFGGFASSFAAAITHPIDTIKVKVQIEGNQKSSAFRILRQSTLSSLFCGLKPAILRSATYGSLRYAIYTPIRDVLAQFHIDEALESMTSPSSTIIRTSNSTNKSSFTEKLIAGSLAGYLASAVCSPTDLIKIRMQASASYGYTSIPDAVRKIVQADGFVGLWKGVTATATRASVLAAAELGVYDQTKESLLHSGFFQDGFLLYLSASLLSGLISSFVTNPFDFAKSRLMNQSYTQGIGGTGYGIQHHQQEAMIYRGMIDCLYRSAKNEGVIVLWSGFFATYARLGPNISITFLVMEQLRMICNQWEGKENPRGNGERWEWVDDLKGSLLNWKK